MSGPARGGRDGRDGPGGSDRGGTSLFRGRRGADEAGTAPGGLRRERLRGAVDPAILGVAVVTGAYVSVFLAATDVVGGTTRTAAAVAVAGIAGVALARWIGERAALRLSAVLLLATLAGYYFAVPASRRALFSARSVALDVLSLLTGLSIIRLAVADAWVLAVAPVPTFLVGYLVGRGRHVAAAGVAGGTLGFLVLTGDASETVTLVGVLGVALATGLSTLSVPGGLRRHGDTLAAVLAAMVLVSATLAVLPAGAAQPWGLDRGTPTLESSLDDDEEVEIVGPTRLSPEVRYAIESPVAGNWHAEAYDTYTGDGWVRSGERSALEGSLEGPPGETTAANTTITAETESTALPSPWQAVDVEGTGAETARVDGHGTVRLGEPLEPGDRVTVESRVLDAEPAELRNASRSYPDEVDQRHTQLPESTPDRVDERTREVLAEADAENPYDQAVAIERYLIEEYDYSLTVERPEGDVADAFLFEMDAGYCVYFATTMVAMLRSQGVPAQFVTGYSTGEQVGEDRYVVRGQDAHAWVKVYFPEHGWVSFDPTPSAERDAAQNASLAEAREGGDENVDVPATEPDPEEPAPDVAPETDDDPDPEPNESGDPSGADDADGDGGDGGATDAVDSEPGQGALTRGGTGEGADAREGAGSAPPSREAIAYWLFAAVIGVTGARRLGVGRRARRVACLWVPWIRIDPTTDARRAFTHLERLLARRFRERRTGETPRAYLDALRARGLDERAVAVGDLHERATYAGAVTRGEADEARRTVRRLALEWTPVVGRLFR
ncbi:transglutaminase domain-containing protein [Halorubrum sp. AD140]|uniref:transglutaminase TgpA family protein n=1 Tax=Halorubrum sp. AD140 TaxID=3050073 RepID=UPI002ACC43F0|nr:transglutaminase domain-containing protein [Halorubrum sp. AD140]MDZ5810741.1 transglutaminase domain-containing protein [Halorubrum sp. AD140]